MVTASIIQTSIFFHTYRFESYFLTVRAGSTHHTTGGTTHYVIESHIHDLFNPSNLDYDVAVLEVYTDSIF
jgi:hypothetical protein